VQLAGAYPDVVPAAPIVIERPEVLGFEKFPDVLLADPPAIVMFAGRPSPLLPENWMTNALALFGSALP
jgi:hypothetical protein